MLVVYILIYGLMFGFLSVVVVKGKNRDEFSWFLIGLIFGVFGFIAAAVVDKIGSEPHPEADAESIVVQIESAFDPSSIDKVCPDCAETIKIEARVCRYCSFRFSDEQIAREVKKSHWNWVGSSDTGANGIRYCNFCGTKTDKNFGTPPFIVCKECSA